MSERVLRYIVVYEQTPNNWGAYVPDLPGCVAVADTREEVRGLIREAIVFHLEGILLDDEPIPDPGYWAETSEIETSMKPIEDVPKVRRTG
jgi:predicted RNase H-like HicB family nuclease